MTPVRARKRIDWVDHAKGICIIFVVLLYSSGTAESVLHVKGWIHAVGDFARAFRMPDFFLVSGLFVSRVIHRQWRDYLDSKVIHFLYFYVLWLTIGFIVAEWRGLIGAQPLQHVADYFSLYLQPHGQLWFIYLLPLFFIAVKATHRIPVFLVASVAIVLKLADLDTGWKMIDRFGMYFVFFYAGHMLASNIFRWVEQLRQHAVIRIVYLLGWCAINAVLVMNGLIEVPIINLVMGLTGAFAIIMVATILAPIRTMGWVGYLGANSLVVYVGFGVPMILLRKVVLTNHLIENVDLASLTLAVLSIVGALIVFWLTHGSSLDFLFSRPSWARLKTSLPVPMVDYDWKNVSEERKASSETSPSSMAGAFDNTPLNGYFVSACKGKGKQDGPQLTAEPGM